MELYALMQKVHQGDQQAFSTLYSRYNDVVFRIAWNATKNEEESLAIVKRVFRTVYLTLKDKGPYEGDFYGWLDALTGKELRHLSKQEVPAESSTIPPAAPPVFQAQPAKVPSAPRSIKAERAASAPIAPAAAAAPVSQRREAPVIPSGPAPHRYTNEEAARIQARAQAVLEGMPQEEPEEETRRGFTFCVFLCIILCLVCVWFLGGLLMRLGVLPPVDLGYQWFNTHLFPLF